MGEQWPSADAIIVFAITSEQMGRKRYSAFLVPHDTPGLSTSEMPGFHALRPSRHCLLTLEDCLVPVTAILGPIGWRMSAWRCRFVTSRTLSAPSALSGAFRHAIGQFAGTTPSTPEQIADLGAIVALTAVFEDRRQCRGRRVGRRPVPRRRRNPRWSPPPRGRNHRSAEGADRNPGHLPSKKLLGLIDDLDAVLSIARGPRLARQTRLGEAAISREVQSQ